MMRSNFGLAESYLNNAAAIDPFSEHLATETLADHNPVDSNSCFINLTTDASKIILAKSSLLFLVSSLSRSPQAYWRC